MSQSAPSRSKKITKKLPCQLSDEERLNFADRLAESNEQVDAAIANKKSMNRQMQNEVDMAVSHRDKINNIVASKNEYRDVDVEVTMDYEHSKVKHIRLDTGEIIVDRPMTIKEKQSSMLEDDEDFEVPEE